jgi:hypothetical protein
LRRAAINQMFAATKPAGKIIVTAATTMFNSPIANALRQRFSCVGF